MRVLSFMSQRTRCWRVVLSGGTTSSLVKTGAFVGESALEQVPCGSIVGPWLGGAIVVGAIVGESDSLLMRTKL